MWYDEYEKEVAKGLLDLERRKAVRRGVETYVSNKKQALRSLPRIEGLRKRAREIKEQSSRHLEDLVKQASKSIESAGGHAYLAKTSDEAQRRVAEVVGSGRLVIKSKSLTCEEISINEALESLGKKVLETDLGEFIIQLRGEKPTHLITPALHVPREAVAEEFSKLLKRRIEPDIPTLVKTAREFLRSHFLSADVGISGANAVAAENGAVFIVENEGNARFVTNAPSKHIAVVGFDKVVPTMEDAFTIVQVLPPYATGSPTASYISIISGPSKTADVEKTLTYGVHGPEQLHVVFVDNGRTRMAEDPMFREALCCIRCGACLFECPIYRILNGRFGNKYFGGIGAVWSAFTHSLEDVAGFTYACTTCGRCKTFCPLDIDIPLLVENLRKLLSRKGFAAPPHRAIAENIDASGNPFGEERAKRLTLG